MAQRRMFSPKIVDSDAFLDMPQSSQLFYFHLAMRADDDGFVGNPKKILRMMGGNDDDIRVLIGKRFILTFESGIIVIKHWKIHNLIRNDRYNETQYLEEKSTLILKENGVYTERNSGLLKDIPNDNHLEPQVRLSKVRLSKEEEGDESPPSLTFERKIKEKDEEYRNLVKDLVAKDYLSAAKIHQIAVEEFLPYWLERSQNGKKARWEKERVFDYKRRFRTWVKKVHEIARDYRCKNDKWHRKGESCYCVKEEVAPKKLISELLPEVRVLGLSKRV